MMVMMVPRWFSSLFVVFAGALCSNGFVVIPSSSVTVTTTTRLAENKRPLREQLASALFRLENDRVKASSQVDEKGREGEPMEWSEPTSLANQFSQVMAKFGYPFKQLVADLVAGDFDEGPLEESINDFVENHTVAMFSFTSCPFCRRAKDYLEANEIPYAVMELDELPEQNRGNEIRAVLGRMTKRTSVPAIFIKGQYIGGCNDGPGLLPLAESGELDKLLARS